MKRLLLVFTMMLVFIGMTMAQRTVTGNVTDATGEALIGASILAKGTSVGTVSDIDGNYSLDVPADATTLVFSYTGYSAQEVDLGSSTILDVVLREGRGKKRREISRVCRSESGWWRHCSFRR